MVVLPPLLCSRCVSSLPYTHHSLKENHSSLPIWCCYFQTLNIVSLHLYLNCKYLTISVKSKVFAIKSLKNSTDFFIHILTSCFSVFTGIYQCLIGWISSFFITSIFYVVHIFYRIIRRHIIVQNQYHYRTIFNDNIKKLISYHITVRTLFIITIFIKFSTCRDILSVIK